MLQSQTEIFTEPRSRTILLSAYGIGSFFVDVSSADQRGQVSAWTSSAGKRNKNRTGGLSVRIMGLFLHSATSNRWGGFMLGNNILTEFVTCVNAHAHTNTQTAFTHENVYMECKYYIKRATSYNIYFNIHCLYEIGCVSIQSVHNQLLFSY